MKSEFGEEMISLIRKSGYPGYSRYLEGKIDESVMEALKPVVEIITAGKDSSELKKIRRYYLEDIKR